MCKEKRQRHQLCAGKPWLWVGISASVHSCRCFQYLHIISQKVVKICLCCQQTLLSLPHWFVIVLGSRKENIIMDQNTQTSLYKQQLAFYRAQVCRINKYETQSISAHSEAPETGGTRWGLVLRGIMNYLFFTHLIFVITCKQISPEEKIFLLCFITGEKEKTIRAQKTMDISEEGK